MKKYIIALIALLFTIIGVLMFLLIPRRKYTNEQFNISTYISAEDTDGDGIDDQTDILEGVRTYIETKPRYKSKYYSTGYPDDEYGVCTDVVANGLKAAGYDLMELVDADIRNDKTAYNIETIDKNIDFRRVRNLKVYFERNAISLTADTNKIEEWQGGDIVIFENHIGIISDKRNRKGVPYVIHHANPYQLRFEEDILEKRAIVGHYRVS